MLQRLEGCTQTGDETRLSTYSRVRQTLSRFREASWAFLSPSWRNMTYLPLRFMSARSLGEQWSVSWVIRAAPLSMAGETPQSYRLEAIHLSATLSCSITLYKTMTDCSPARWRVSYD